MDWQKRADSVIARLMGIEQLRPRQHVKRRVLSESYIHKTATIGRSLVSNHSRGVKNDIVNPVKGMPGVQTRKGNNDIVLEKCTNLTTGNGKLVQSNVSGGNRCVGCTHNMGLSGQVRGRSKLVDVSERRYISGLEPASHLLNQSKNQIFERCTWREQTLTKMLALADKKSMLTRSGDLIYRHDGSEHEENHSNEVTVELSSSKVPMYIEGLQDGVDGGSKNEICREIRLSQRSSISNVAPCDHLGARGAMEVGHSSHRNEDFGREVSQSEFSEDASTFSNSSANFTPEFQEDGKRTCQHSPDSVLKYGQSSSPFQFFNNIGLELRIQMLNFEREDTYSEASSVCVSGDTDSEEQFCNRSHDDSVKIERWIGDDEDRRNFSYLVDVLAEAGFCGVDSKTWYSFESPINPLVFEVLEKQYSKQTSWHKSDRQLLFDSINSALIHIFNPVITFHTSIQNPVRANLKRDEVEDELWRMINTQEEGRTKDLSNGAVEKWFEAEEGMNLLCRELEIDLFDELVTELFVGSNR